MSRMYFTVLFALVFVSCTVAFSVDASGKDPQESGAGMINLEGGSLGAVQFPHRLHQQKINDCNACHDLFPREKGAIKAQQEAGKLEKQQVMNIHCIKCHMERNSASKPSGPTQCAKCHRR